MKRVYTDNRFPGVEVVNNGDTTFVIQENGQSIGRFLASETDAPNVSEAFAQRRAKAYFERRHINSVPEQAVSIRRKRLSDSSAPVRKQVALKPRAPAAVDLDALIARARTEPDPVKAAALKKQAIDLMAKEESVAKQVVGSLLS